MFVQTEITPNPNSLKFLPGKTVSNFGSIEVTKKDANNRPLELQQFDYGIKYFMDPTSLYTNEKQGTSNTLPIIIGNAQQSQSEMEQLIQQGYKPWQ